MNKVLRYISFVLLFVTGTLTCFAEGGGNIRSSPNTTTTLLYNTTSLFKSGVTSGTLTLTVDNLNTSTQYRVYFRANGSTNFGSIPFSDVKFQVTGYSVTNSRILSSVSMVAVSPVATSYSSSNTGAAILFQFTTPSNITSSDVITITFTITGPSYLFVNGGTTASPTYYPNSTGVRFDYDLRDVTRNNWDDNNDGSNHNVRLGVVDAITITSFSPVTVTMVANTSSKLSSGFTQSQNNHFSICSNRAYNLAVKASGTNFVPTSGSGTSVTIPVSVIQLKINNSNTTGWTVSGFTALNGTTNISLASVIPKSSATTPDYLIGIDYKLVPGVNNLSSKVKQVYSTVLTYTVTEN